MHKGLTRWLLVVTMLAAATAFAACGGDDDEAAQQPQGQTNGAQVEGNGVDRAFVAGMVPHHESAIEMARIAQERAQSDFVRDLAEDIIKTQASEIETLKRVDAQLAGSVDVGDLGVPDHLKGMDQDMEMLRKADPFDREFIDMMVPHHEGAIAMAEAELEKGENPELKKLAQAVIDAQQREIDEMNEHRKENFGGPVPESGAHSQVTPRPRARRTAKLDTGGQNAAHAAK